MNKLIFVMLGLFLSFIIGGSAQARSPQEVMTWMVSATGEASVIQGKDGWLFLKEELLHLSIPTYFGESSASDPVPAIVDFNRQLREKNIDLLLVLIPPKALIYPDMLPDSFTQEMVESLEKPYNDLYAKLAQEGVNSLNLISKYREARQREQIYCKTDSHFSGQGLDVATEKIAAQITDKSWYAAIPKTEYSVADKEVTIKGDLSQMLGAAETEKLSLGFVTDSVTGKAVMPDPDSPLLLLGDSHTLVFSVGGDLHTKGAGLFDHLTAALGFAVDRIGVRGSGATPSRIKLFQRSRKDPAFLSNKKIIVWCLSARELTGTGGWRKIPIEKK